jgi:sterol desaturase/sphingolipid hydroxylase (fatty acid hydroxylase superfamily)
MIAIISFEVFFYLLDYFYLSRRKNLPECYKYSSENLVSSLFLNTLFFHTKLINGLFVMLSYRYLNSFQIFPKIVYDRNIIYFIVLYLGVDLSFWIAHFLSHKYKWLWYNHLAHHASAKFNYAVNWRLGFLEVFNFLPAIVIFSLLGFPEKDFFYVFLINVFHMGWAHTSFPKIKWLEYIFVTPSNHRVHHYKGKLGGRCNYGGTFIFWDRLFGTYQEEDTNQQVSFGVSGVDGESIRPIAESLPGFFNLKEMQTTQLSIADLIFSVSNFAASGIILSLKFHFKDFTPLDKFYFAFIVVLTWLSAIYFEFKFNLNKNLNLTFKLLSIFNLWCLIDLIWLNHWSLPKNPGYIFLALTFIFLIIFSLEKAYQKPKNHNL